MMHTRIARLVTGLSQKIAIFTLAAIASFSASAAIDLIDSNGDALPIVVAAGSSEANTAAAEDLARIIDGITGQRPEIISGDDEPLPARAIWIGIQPAVEAVIAGSDLSFSKPEEILIIVGDSNILIAGRDRFDGDDQLEFGTANAVYTFIQRFLDVAWLWPGELGEAFEQRPNISLEAAELRFHPPFRSRVFRYPRNLTGAREVNRWWDVVQRGRGSLRMRFGHAWGDWWDLYHEDHPEWFALKPDGTRGPFPQPNRVKMCVSNPEIVGEWLRRVEQQFLDDPDLEIIGVTPNDGGGWCVCENCMAWDSPDGAPSDLYGQPYVALTDRYVRFWNKLAEALQNRFPDRNVGIATLAYSRYSAPPVDNAPRENITIGQVGHFPMTHNEQRYRQKAELLEWAELASSLYFRPNWFYWGGGIWGMPEVAMDETIEDFRFLAENRVFALDIDSAQMNYATLGPQLYVMAQFGYDPLADGAAIMDQYYRLGFGPAAETMKAYWQIFQDARRAMMENEEFATGSRFYRSASMARLYRDSYPPELFKRARTLLDTAEAQVADANPVFRERIDFVRYGLDYTEVMVDTIEAMAAIRRGGDSGNAQHALELSNKRLAIMAAAPPFALDQRRLLAQMARRGGHSILGPPSAEQLIADKRQTMVPQFIFGEPQWELAWEENFDGDSLGDDWNPIRGTWTTEDGWLKSGGGTIVSKRRFPGLQRIVFEVMTNLSATDFREGESATGSPSPSDISPLIHISDANTRNGYFMQFGGNYNTRSAVRRGNAVVYENHEARIIPEHLHTIIAELDGNHVRLIVDGDTILEFADPAPLIGPDHEQFGIYLYTAAKFKSIRVYSAEPTKIVNPDWDPNVHDPDFE